MQVFSKTYAPAACNRLCETPPAAAPRRGPLRPPARRRKRRPQRPFLLCKSIGAQTPPKMPNWRQRAGRRRRCPGRPARVRRRPERSAAGGRRLPAPVSTHAATRPHRVDTCIYLSCFLLPALLFSSRIFSKNRWSAGRLAWKPSLAAVRKRLRVRRVDSRIPPTPATPPRSRGGVRSARRANG